MLFKLARRCWRRAILAQALALHVAPSPVVAQGSGAGDENLAAKKVTLNVENADIRYALKLLLQSVGVNHTIYQAVQGTVTAQLADVRFAVALENVLKSVQSQAPLTYDREEGIYHIRVKQEALPEQPATTEQPDTTRARTNPQKLKVKSVDANILAQILGGSALDIGQATQQRSGSGDGSGCGSGGLGSNGYGSNSSRAYGSNRSGSGYGSGYGSGSSGYNGGTYGGSR